MATPRPSPVTAGDDDDSLPPTSFFSPPEIAPLSNYDDIHVSITTWILLRPFK